MTVICDTVSENCTFCSLSRGFLAGFIATIFISIIIFIKDFLGIVPEFDLIYILNIAISQQISLSDSVLIGWVVHFIIGTVLGGGLFIILNQILPGKKQLIKGVTFGLIAWLFMMFVIMPLNNFGLFGLKLGVVVPTFLLGFHLVYGMIIGTVYKSLTLYE